MDDSSIFDSVLGDGLFAGLLWSADPTTQTAILCVAGIGIAGLLGLHGPLWLRVIQLHVLRTRVLRSLSSDLALVDARKQLDEAFDSSPASSQFEEFLRRWRGSAVSDRPDTAPVRMGDVLETSPLLPDGARRSLMSALPGLLLGLGVLGGFVGLALASGAGSDDPAARAAMLVAALGLACRTAVWGLLLALLATVSSRIIEGRFEYYTRDLDQLVELAYACVSRSELAGQPDRSVQPALDRLRADLASMIDVRLAEQSAATNTLQSALEAFRRDSAGSAQSTATLHLAATAVEGAAETLTRATADASPTLEQLRDTSSSLGERLADLESGLAQRISEGFAVHAERAAAAEPGGGTPDVDLEPLRADLALLREGIEGQHAPVRAMLGDLEANSASLTRAVSDFAARSDAAEKSLDALRAGLSEEGRELRNAVGELGSQLERALATLADLEAPLDAESTLAEEAAGALEPPTEPPPSLADEAPSPEPPPTMDFDLAATLTEPSVPPAPEPHDRVSSELPMPQFDDLAPPDDRERAGGDGKRLSSLLRRTGPPRGRREES